MTTQQALQITFAHHSPAVAPRTKAPRTLATALAPPPARNTAHGSQTSLAPPPTEPLA